jgi:ABC-2 type transport system permease protein
MKVLAIIQANLLRASRDRNALFFSVLLPIILILVLGLTYGSQASARVGLLDQDGGPVAAQLVDEVQKASDVRVDIRRYDSLESLRDAAARGLVQVGVAIPAGYSARLQAGDSAPVVIVAAQTQVGTAIRTTAERAVAAQAALFRAARFAAAATGVPFATALQSATAVAAAVPGVATKVEPVNAADTSRNGFNSGAQGQLVLFMFLTSLTGAIELVISRQLGISRRMFSTPTGMGTIVLGEALARIAFALIQGVFIVAASAVLFGVSWGDPLAASAVVLVFAFVSGGAAMIVGSIASNPSQAGALGPALGMVFGLFGGAMVPASLFPESMRTLSRLTPHAWAMDALGDLGEAGAGITRILPQLGVLAGFAVLFFGIAVLRFRRVLQSGS